METLSDQPLGGEMAGVLGASDAAPTGISAGTIPDASSHNVPS